MTPEPSPEPPRHPNPSVASVGMWKGIAATWEACYRRLARAAEEHLNSCEGSSVSDMYDPETMDLVEILRGLANAYPEDVFPTPPENRQAKNAAAAHVMRRLAVPWFNLAADEIERLRVDRVATHVDG